MGDSVYIFYYNDCTFESAAMAMSLHRTKKGAYMEMRKHITQSWFDWRKECMNYGKRYATHDWNFGREWFIGKLPILE